MLQSREQVKRFLLTYIDEMMDFCDDNAYTNMTYKDLADDIIKYGESLDQEYTELEEMMKSFYDPQEKVS